MTDQGEVALRPFYAELTKRLEARPGCFVVLDSLADIAIMSEEKRLAVNAFLKRAVGRLCDNYGATVLVLGHPSKTSINDGTLYSGSTAFNNAVRSRITLQAGKDGIGGPERVLQTAKMNYTASSSMELFLWGKVFQAANSLSAAATQAHERDAVLSTVKRLLGKGVRINRGNGSGQKARDVAQEVFDEHGLLVTAARVQEILSQAERRGELCYQAGYGKQLAGYVLPEDVLASSS